MAPVIVFKYLMSHLQYIDFLLKARTCSEFRCKWSSLCLCWINSLHPGPVEGNQAAITVNWTQSKPVSPALLIRGPAISVWVVVLWCKDNKMSGSLVDQVNHVLSLKQWSSAVASAGLTPAACLSVSWGTCSAVCGSDFQPRKLRKLRPRET